MKTIHRETQLVDQTTGESVHKNLGVFVLMITSHGYEHCIAGVDGKLVKLADIYDLLSARNFPAMQGKPKLLFIQACAGGTCILYVLTYYCVMIIMTHWLSQGLYYDDD